MSERRSAPENPILSEEMCQKLCEWFRMNKREMAWRSVPTPYHVLVSEIMLQQTRVETVRPYYDRFIHTFPTVEALANADEDAIVKLWEGLGYYSRVRNLQKACKAIQEQYNGIFPDTYDALVKLPGIGSYTAGAILSIAFHQPVPVVDGNVLRVVSRMLARPADVRDPKTKQTMETELADVLQRTSCDPSDLNQGLMELGALVCVPGKTPRCEVCPWKNDCEALRLELTGTLPVVGRKPEKREEEWTVLIVYVNDRVGLVKRTGQGVLNGLYSFPMIEGSLNEQEVGRLFSEQAVIRPLPKKKHVFTHVVWQMNAYEVRILDRSEIKDGTLQESMFFVSETELANTYALPSAFKKWEINCFEN